MSNSDSLAAKAAWFAVAIAAFLFFLGIGVHSLVTQIRHPHYPVLGVTQSGQRP